MILDEPLAQLDPDSEAAVLDAIVSLARSRTALAITHRPERLGGADVIALDEGRVVEVGPGVGRDDGGGDVSPLRRLLGLAAPVRGWVVLATLSSFVALAANVALMTAAPYLISKAALVTGFAALALSVTAVRAFAISRAALPVRRAVHAPPRGPADPHTPPRGLHRAVEPLAPGGLEGHRTGDLLARAVADVATLDDFFVRGSCRRSPPSWRCCWPPGSSGPSRRRRSASSCCVRARDRGRGDPPRDASRVAPSGRGRRGGRASLHAELADDVTGLADLLAFGAASRLGSRLLDRSRRIGDGLRRLAFVRGAGVAAGAMLSGLVGVVLLVLAAPLVRGGELDGVFLAAVPLVAFAAFEAVQPLGDVRNDRAEPRGRGPDVRGDRHGTRSSSIRRRRVRVPGSRASRSTTSFRYEAGGPKVLDGLNFELPPGHRLGIAGPNGAGKTTIVGLLLCASGAERRHRPRGGHDVRSFRADDVRSMLGVVPQRIHLFNGSLRDNLLLADGEADDSRIAEAMTRARLGSFLASLPAGLDTHVGEDGLKFSGGERQRLALARVFLKDAPILILDEATSHLDADRGGGP